MTNFFLTIYSFLKTRKAIRVILLLACCCFIGFFASKISLEEDIAGFMPKGENSERINFVYKNIGISDKIVVRFSAKDTTKKIERESLIDASEMFVSHFDSLTTGKGYVKDIFYKIDQDNIVEVADFLTKNTPYFLTEEDYVRIDSLLTPENIKELLENNKKILVSPTGMVLKKNIIADPLHLSSTTLSRLRDFQVSNQYEIYNDYIFSKKGENLLLFISSANAVSETAKNKELVAFLDNSISYVQSQLGEEFVVSYFGAAPVAVTNAERMKTDSYVSIIIAVVLILALLFWFFRDIKSMLLIAIPVVFGAFLSLAALYFIKGTISAIAIGAGSVIFGIAINYSLHFLIHSKQESNPIKVLKDLASPMLTGSITTVGAFLSLLFISADSMRDFGLFAAFSLAGTLLFVLIFMPHLVGRMKYSGEGRKHHVLDKISDYRFEKNRYVLFAVLVLTGIFLYFSFSISFETNMHKINYMKPDQRKAFDELSNFSTVGKKNVYLVSEGNNLNEALINYENTLSSVDSLVRNGHVTDIAGIGAFLPSDSMQQVKIDRWNSFWEPRKELLKEMLSKQGASVGFKENSFDSFFAQLDQTYTVQAPAYFSIITASFANEYLIVKDDRAMVVTMLYTTPQHADLIAKRFTHGDSFIFDSGSVSKSLIKVLSNDFNTVLFMCSLLVLVFLTISFGRLELSLISFLPMLVSWVWILGIMSMFNISFNIVNIILATFIFGLGDDYTIFMMDGMMNEYAYRRKLLASYKTAVALSAVTMLIGIGTLIFAKHPAMKSLADVTIIGMISVVIISYVIPPLLYNYLTIKKGRKRLIPITFQNAAGTIFSFIVFLVGSLILSITGFLLFRITKSTERKKFFCHQLLCRMAKISVKYMPGVTSRIINDYKESFEKPGVIICNHQAHIDLMFVMMLSPKLVILTNEWVWNSPFYGRIIKYVDFYPVANGIENSIEKLSTLAERGYSIVVFPEGTRSEDSSILRFHRGAFYLAEKLQLDIIPIVVHGIGHALPKSELLLRKGEVTVKILDRISPDDFRFGENYSQRTKTIRQFYKKEYKQLCDEFETPSYFSSLVIHNYIYKGASIEKQARKEMRRFDNFEKLISLLPSTGKMLNANCKWGVFALTCSLVKKDLQILAIDSDEDKIDLATNCVSKPANLDFRKNDIASLLPDIDFVVLINPQEREVSELCHSAQKTLYLLIEKENHLFESFSTFENSSIVYDTSKYAIIIYKHL